MNKKSSQFLKILTYRLVDQTYYTSQDSYLDLFSCIFLITRTTISRKEGSSLCSRFTALPTQRLARKSTALLFFFTSTCADSVVLAQWSM